MQKRVLFFIALILFLTGLSVFFRQLLPVWLLPVVLIVTFFFLVNLTPLFMRRKRIDDSAEPLMDERAAEVVIKNGRRRAVFLVHGFCSNPWLYHKHIPLFEAAGYDVIAPRLAGHGISPEFFMKTGFSDYYASLVSCYTRHRGEYDAFHVVGISMGGLLTLRLAEDFGSKKFQQSVSAPTTITTLAAPVVMKDPRLPILRTLSWVVPRIRGVWDPEKRECDGAECWLGYHDLFLRQSWSLVMAMVRIRSDLKKITLPHFLIHAKSDLDVPYDNMLKIAGATSSNDLQMWVPDLSGFNHSGHSLFLYDSLIEPLNRRILDFIGSRESL